MLEGSIGFDAYTIAIFIAFVVGCLLLDLFSHRKDKPVSLKDAIGWSLVWVALALVFYGFLIWHFGSEKAAPFLTGYVLEKALSVDNLMVFIAIFSSFAVPDGYRHRILFYGVLGAMFFRLVFVGIGSALYALGPWVDVLFAAIIAWSAVQMLKSEEGEEEIEDYSDHWSVRMTKRFMPVWPKLYHHNFFAPGHAVTQLMAHPENAGLDVKKGKGYYATPLFLCLVTVEISDVMFSFDSVPAVIAVTKDPLLVYSAMIFAIMGLRQMYFVLEAMQKYLVHLGRAVICLLFFIAFKLVLNAANHFHWTDFSIDPNTSLMIVLGMLAAGVVASFIFPEKDEDKGEDRGAA
jgi:tellurite resistance protein TerC